MKKFLMIGQIVKPQGVRGEIKVLPLTDDPERYLDLEYVFLDEKVCRFTDEGMFVSNHILSEVLDF